MVDQVDIALGRTASRLRLDTLVRLRWLAVIGQSVAVAGVWFGLGFPLPFGLCFLVIGASAALNIGLRVRFPVSYRLGEHAALALLGWDVLQLAALLFLTGGLQNPFALLFLAPVLISAAALPPRRTLLLGGLVAALATVLAVYHLPLPWMPDERLLLPPLYRAGIWLAVMLGIAFTGVYAWRVAVEARELSQALAAAELVLAREQHISQIDGLAAAAAHELGTPLGTISLVAREMQREIEKLGPGGSLLAEDIALLRQEAERCRAILGKLTSLREDGGPLARMSVGQVLEEVAGPQRPFDVPISLSADGVGPEPVMRRNAGVLYGLGNLVDNAVDFASRGVTLRARWSPETVAIEVIDDGRGFPEDILMRAGEPYLSTRAKGGRGAAPGREGAATGRDPERAAGRDHGLGLGLFIAKTLLERSGATVSFANRPAPDSGAQITVQWPRAAFEGSDA